MSSTELTFYGEEGNDVLSFSLTVVGLVDENVTVKLSSAVLYDNSSKNSVELGATEASNAVKKNEEQTIIVNLNVTATKAGTYKGAVIVTAETTQNITATIVPVTAKIVEVAQWYYPIGQWGLVFITLSLIGAALIFPENKKKNIWKFNVVSKMSWVVIFGISAVSLWLVSLVISGIGEPSNMVTTVLVTPFVLYVINCVKDKRTERLEKEKISRKIQNEGSKKDIELIRSLLGELSTHCASFTPFYCEEKLGLPPAQYVSNPEVVYHSMGIISREVWDENRKQGIVANIHTLYLEKYYDFIPKYNRLYRTARYILKNPNITPSPPRNFFDLFDEFRKKYCNIEKILFVYLSYILELWSRTTLSPIKVDYPRISRTLLYALIEYEILKPGTYIDELDGFKKNDLSKELKKDVTEDERSDQNRLKKIKTDITKKSEKNVLEKFKKIAKDKNETQELACYKVLRTWLIKKFKDKIHSWSLSANDIEKIMNYIYQENNVTLFFSEFQKDFYKKYVNLKQSDILTIKGLPEVPETDEPEKREYTLNIGNIYKKKTKKEEASITKETFDVGIK